MSNKVNKRSKGQRKKQVLALICLIVVAAMLITTFVSALFVY